MFYRLILFRLPFKPYNRLMKKYLGLAAILLIALAYQGGQMYSGMEVTGFVGAIDDAYYYFQIARNIATGHGSSFDGENPTNGYHPLWMAINVLVYWLMPGQNIAPIVFLKIISAGLFLGSIFLLWRLLGKISDNDWLKTTLLFFYILAPINLQFSNDGLETALVLFLFLGFYLKFLSALENPSAKNHLLLGLLGGLMVLGRTDYVIFALAAFLYIFIAKKENRWRNCALLAVGFLPVILPWILINILKFGMLLPSSGLAYTRINHDWFFSKPRTAIQVALWGGYQFSSNVIFFILNAIGFPLPEFPVVNPKIVLTVCAGLAAAALLWFWWFVWKKRQTAFWEIFFRSQLGQSFLVLLTGFLGLTILHGGIRWSGRPWYYITAPVFLAVGAALFLEKIFETKHWIWKKSLLLFFIAAAALSYKTYADRLNIASSFGPREVEKYRSAIWISKNLPENARIASFNSGVIGYFAKRFVMNSDGLVNNSAYKYMRDHKPLWLLFKEKNIDYLADTERTLDRGRIIWIGTNPISHLKMIYTDEVLHDPNSAQNVYRVLFYEPFNLYYPNKKIAS